jgi:hypothetical protein
MMNSIYGRVPDLRLVVAAQIGGLMLRAGPYDPPPAARLGQSLAEKRELSNICSMWVVTAADAYAAIFFTVYLQEKYHYKLDDHPALVSELG